MFSAFFNAKEQQLAGIFDCEVDPFIPPHHVSKLAVKEIKKILLHSTIKQLNTRNKKGFTYLQVAIAYAKRLPEFIEIVEILLHHGADPNLLAIEVKDTNANRFIQQNRKHTLDFSALDFVNSIRTHIKDTDEKLNTLLVTHGAKLKKFAPIKKLYTINASEVKTEIKESESKNVVQAHVERKNEVEHDDKLIRTIKRKTNVKDEADPVLIAANEMVSAIDYKDGTYYREKFKEKYLEVMNYLNDGQDWSVKDSSSKNIFHIICDHIHLICNYFTSVNPVNLQDHNMGVLDQKNHSKIKFEFFQFFSDLKLDDANRLKLKSCLETETISYRFYGNFDCNALQLFLRRYDDTYDKDLYFEIFDALLQLYLKVGAELHPKTAGKLSPLMLAVRSGDDRLVKALIEAGADVNETRDCDLPIPAIYADLCGHYEIANTIKHLMFKQKK